MKARVFFIEGSVYISYPREPWLNLGGSSKSLGLLVAALDKNEFDPAVLFYYASPVAADLERSGVRVLRRRSRAEPAKKAKAASRLFSAHAYSNLAYAKRFIQNIFPEAVRLAGILKRERPHIVHTNISLEADLASILACRLAGLPCVSHVRDFERIRPIQRIAGRAVGRVLCISDAVLSHCLALGIPPKRLLRIYNGVDLSLFPSPPKAPSQVVAQIGRMVAWKGHRVLLEAAPLVLKACPETGFLLAGDGPERQALERLALSMGLGNRVRFAGAVREVIPVLEEAAVLANPSLSPEPFGRAIVEAMATARPVVASSGGGPEEIITSGHDGYIVPPGDPAALASALIRLLKDRVFCKEMGRNGRLTVERRFDHRETARSVERVYGEILGS